MICADSPPKVTLLHSALYSATVIVSPAAIITSSWLVGTTPLSQVKGSVQFPFWAEVMVPKIGAPSIST